MQIPKKKKSQEILSNKNLKIVSDQDDVMLLTFIIANLREDKCFSFISPAGLNLKVLSFVAIRI